MAQFLTRVELHNEQPNDYPRLHAEMEARAFSRKVLLETGWHHLPHATYLSDSIFSRDAVIEHAKAAVASIGRRAGIIVAEMTADGLISNGLIPVR